MRKKYSFLNKTLVIGTILLFFGVSIVSALNISIESSEMVFNIENSGNTIENFYPIDDAGLSQDAPNTNKGDSESMTIRNEYGFGGGSGWGADGLIKFDISSIPSRATIIRATLFLFYNKWTSTNPAGRMLNIYRLTEDWNEDTVTWNTAPAYNPVASAYAPVPATVNVWIEWDVTSDVQGFHSGTNNYGWRIRDDNYWGTFDIPLTQVRTKEFGQEVLPYLEIEFTRARSRHTIDEETNAKSEREPLIYHFYGWCENVNTKGLVFNKPIEANPGKYDFYLNGIFFQVQPKNSVKASHFIGYIREIRTQGVVFYRVRGIAFGNIEWS